MNTSVENHLSTARLYAVRKAPYFAAALLSLVPREAPGLGTMGVTERMVLLYDPVTVLTWSVSQLGSVLLHEVGHVLRAHAKRRGERDPKLWNVAGDMEINDDLVAMALDLPGEALLPRTYGFPDGLPAEDYYARLTAQAQKGKGKPSPGNSPPKPGSDPGADGKPGRCCGQCGSGAGNPLPDEPADGEGGRSDAEVERVRLQVAEAITQHTAEKGRGSVPAGLTRWANALRAPPKIRWQDRLSRAVRSAVAYRPGAVDLRYSRPSRRQGALGFGAGAPILPAYVRPVPRVAVAIDTSGSMGEAELEIVLREVGGILAAVGAAVDYCACDAAVHSMGRAQDVRSIARALKGGGGTDFRPIFPALARRRPAPEVILVCTDGGGPAPAAPPPGVRVVWVLVGEHRYRPCAWGTVVEVD